MRHYKRTLILAIAIFFAAIVSLSVPDSAVAEKEKEFVALSAGHPAPAHFDGFEFIDKALETTTTTVPPTTTTTVEQTTTTTAAPAPPPPQEEVEPVATGSGYADPNNMATWDRLAQCESGGDWHINTGNGYYGGIQFSLSSWQAVGGTGYPHEHSRETQIAMGQRLWNQGGWDHWPACSSKLGYR